MSDKRKFPRSVALDVARELLGVIAPHAERVIVAGSLRRKKPEVGDVEIIFIPKIVVQQDPTQLFAVPLKLNCTVTAIEGLLVGGGVLAKRENVKGCEMWGEKNKLAVHVASGIPVDLFAATEENWWNYVVCRTGGAESNVAICNAAIRKGWKWNPYGEGFSRAKGLGRESHAIGSEREVFEFVGLDYLEPWERS